MIVSVVCPLSLVTCPQVRLYEQTKDKGQRTNLLRNKVRPYVAIGAANAIHIAVGI